MSVDFNFFKLKIIIFFFYFVAIYYVKVLKKSLRLQKIYNKSIWIFVYDI